MKTPFPSLASRIRDRFSSSVLGTTSPAAPALSGGLSLKTRGAITAASIAIAIVLAFAFRGIAGALAVSFFFPALMMAALFGASVPTAISIIVVVALAAIFFTSALGTIVFALALILQSAIALAMRALFRESRRWGVRYRRLIDAVTAGIVISDQMGQIHQRQPEFERLIGMRWPDYAGMGWLKAVHPDDLMIAPGEPGVRDNVLRRTVRLRDPGTNDWRWYQFRSIAIPGRDDQPEELVSVLFDVHRQRLAQEERDIRAGEMRHRWKNLMTVIHAMATSSQPAGDDAVAAYVRKLLGRLNALSAAGDQAIASPSAYDIGSAVRATLSPFIAENPPRIEIEGPPCLVSEATGGAFALGVHELATNAIKYGALSDPRGTVKVCWHIDDLGRDEQVTFEWIEKDGPPVGKPGADSFGTRVIRFIPARERNGKVDIEYRPQGLYCRVTFVREKTGIAA